MHNQTGHKTKSIFQTSTHPSRFSLNTNFIYTTITLQICVYKEQTVYNVYDCVFRHWTVNILRTDINIYITSTSHLYPKALYNKHFFIQF